MRTRRSAGNGGSQSSLQDNIDVALPQLIPTSEPPRKRIKLKLSRSSSSFREEPAALPANPRPKRQSTGRVSYAEEGFVPKAVKPPGPLRMSPSLSSLSSPMSQASAERQEMTPSYGAAFLDNYIDDAVLSSNGEPQLPSKPTGLSTPSGPTNSTPAKRLRIRFAKGEAKSFGSSVSSQIADSTPAQNTMFGSSDGVNFVGTNNVLKKVQKIESPATINRKLQAACHALDSLNISAGPVSQNLPPLPPQQEPDVDNLLLAAAGSSPTAEKNLSHIFIGTMDDDMDLLVKNAIQIFRSNLVTKNQLAAHLSGGSARSRGGRKAKGSEYGLYNADKERFAMASLEELLDGNALNVNCIIFRERVHMMWYLYRQLQSLMGVGDPSPHTNPIFSPGMQAIPMPHPIQPRPVSPHQFMQRPQIASQHQHVEVDSSPLQSQKHPVGPRQPHQFLFTQAYTSPYPSGGKVAIQLKQKRPETSNHSSQSTYPEINHIQHGHGTPGMHQNMGPPPFPYVTRFPHPGMAMSTPYGHMPRQSMTPVSASGAAIAPNGAFMIASPAGPQGSGGAVAAAED